MTHKVFVSVGRTFRAEQEVFLTAFEQFLQTQGLEPQIVNRNVFSSMQPLKFIEQVMQESAGTVILAFERLYIQEGRDKRGSEAEKPLQEVKLPTVWNQIEAAMAYTLRQPLLVLVEEGLRSEGLLETGYDWYVQWIKFEPGTLIDRQFTGIFADWRARVEAYAEAGGDSKPRRSKPKA